MNSSYSALHDAIRDCVLKGPMERLFVGVVYTSIQHQIEGGSLGKVIPFLPILQSVSPEAPEFWDAGCNLELAVANEEEVVGPF